MMSDMRALFTLLLPLACAAQPDPFLHWLNQKAQHQLDQRERTIAQITTRAQADAAMAEETGVPVGMVSSGPRARDKRWW